MKKLIGLVFALCLAVAHAQNVTGNLVTNPSFTSATSGVPTGWSITGHGSALSHPIVGANQYSFGTQGSVAQSIAINNALAGTGIAVNGIQYGWRFANYCANSVGNTTSCTSTSTGPVDTLTANVNVTNNVGGTVFDRTHVYNTKAWSWISEAQDVNFTSTPLASIGNLNISFTGVDAGGSTAAPYYGPSVTTVYARLKYGTDLCTSDPLSDPACPGYQAAYTTQQCTANPLYNSSCPGYAAAMLVIQCSANPLSDPTCPGYAQAIYTQQCSVNPLYATTCPGYAAAYKTQQCTATPLYATDCPGYAQAYLNSQCIINSLYSRLCSGYSTAYAIKYLAPLDTTTASAVNGSLSTTAAVKASDPVSINTNGTVSTTPSATGNSTVDSVISTPSTTSTTGVTSVTSVTSVINPPPPPGGSANTSPPPSPPPPAQAAAAATENKKTDGAVASVEKKSGGNQAAAKAAATERAKELANEAGKAATLEQQAATQGLVVGLMGYVPGFSAYQNSIVPDVNVVRMTRQYNKPVVDNRNAQRQLSGSNEAKWQEMVDSQYKQGN
jgi:hypothetical protein